LFVVVFRFKHLQAQAKLKSVKIKDKVDSHPIG